MTLRDMQAGLQRTIEAGILETKLAKLGGGFGKLSCRARAHVLVQKDDGPAHKRERGK